MVDVTGATKAVTVAAETPQHEQALAYCAASEQALTYAGTVFVGEAGGVGVVARFLYREGVEGVGFSLARCVVTVTVTPGLYSVTHAVLSEFSG